MITPGAKPIMFFTIMALCEEGDEVLYPDPGFPMYESIAAFAGATPVPMPLREENGVPHRPRRAAVARHRPDPAADPQLPAQPVRQRAHRERARGASPTIAHRARPRRPVRRGLLGDCATTASTTASLDLDGMARPDDPPRRLVEDVRDDRLAARLRRRSRSRWSSRSTRLVINSVSCTSAFSQHAAMAALEGPWEPSTQMLAEFRKRREVIVSGLNADRGVSCVEPGGAFYAFPNISELGRPRARPGRPPARRSRRGLPVGYGVRPVRRGLPALLLRELGRQHPPRSRRLHGTRQLKASSGWMSRCPDGRSGLGVMAGTLSPASVIRRASRSRSRSATCTCDW